MSVQRSGLISDDDREGWVESVERMAAVSAAIDESLHPVEDRRLVFMCACERLGPDGHPGCNTIVASAGAWCGLCKNDRVCRPDLATPRSVEMVARWLERLCAWARGFNYDRRCDRVRWAAEVGTRRWDEGRPSFTITGTSEERVANGYRPLPPQGFVVVDRDGSRWIL